MNDAVDGRYDVDDVAQGVPKLGHVERNLVESANFVICQHSYQFVTSSDFPLCKWPLFYTLIQCTIKIRAAKSSNYEYLIVLFAPIDGGRGIAPITLGYQSGRHPVIHKYELSQKKHGSKFSLAKGESRFED